MHPFPDDGFVYLVTQADRSAGRPTTAIVDAAIAGGVDIVQLREKDRPASERYQIGQYLRERTREAGVPLIVNDRIDLAAAIEADGVHLGDEDLPIGVARAQLGSDAIVGRSVSTPERAREAASEGADYLGVGAIYQTDSKEKDSEKMAIGLDQLGDVAAATDLPVVGIGGVTAENAAAVIAAGAAGVAVITEITRAEDPEVATRALEEAVATGSRRR